MSSEKVSEPSLAVQWKAWTTFRTTTPEGRQVLRSMEPSAPEILLALSHYQHTDRENNDNCEVCKRETEAFTDGIGHGVESMAETIRAKDDRITALEEANAKLEGVNVKFQDDIIDYHERVTALEQERDGLVRRAEDAEDTEHKCQLEFLEKDERIAALEAELVDVKLDRDELKECFEESKGLTERVRELRDALHKAIVDRPGTDYKELANIWRGESEGGG